MTRMLEAVPDRATTWRNTSTDRRSLIGAAAIALVVLTFVVVVPVVEDNVEYTRGLDAGRLAIDEYTTIELADGWTIESQSDFFFSLTDGTFDLIVVVSNEDSTSPAASLEQAHDAFASNSANAVTPIEEFTTDDGAPGATYRALVASDPGGRGSAFWAVSQNGRLIQPGTTGPSDLDDPGYDRIDAMVRSIVITAEPSGGNS